MVSDARVVTPMLSSSLVLLNSMVKNEMKVLVMDCVLGGGSLNLEG